MFISKITLNVTANKSSLFWETFKDEYSIHQAIWDLFADSPDRRRDFLYRLDYLGKMPVIYTVSERAPREDSPIWYVEKKIYEPYISNNIQLGFMLRVNPTCKRIGKRHDVVMDYKKKLTEEESKDKLIAEIVNDSCYKWLSERSEKHGFKLIQFRADGYRQMKYYKQKNSGFIQYSTVDLVGVLEVINVQEFKNMLFKGIGAEKGFGCGLMMVKKI